MPDLKSCPQCSCPIPAAAPAGLCPTCLLRLGLENTPRPDDTPRTDEATGHLQQSGTTTADLSRSPDSTGPFQAVAPARGLDAGGSSSSRPLVLGNLEIYEEVGRGGMGVVYRARQKLANREVAVKVLGINQAIRPDLADRFKREIEALAGLRHPNIVDVYEVGEETGCVYFAMEFVPGGSLAGRLKSQPMIPGEAAAIIEQLADAVHAAHEMGLIHRDIKPGNVLIAAGRKAKLTDFGLARWIDQEEGLTETGAVLGTPSYMAPEQAAGSKQGTLGRAADVYGLGATLYELLTGRAPFRGANTFETVRKVLNDPPVPPRLVNPAIDSDLESVCLKCLEKAPARRYATAHELAEDLRRWKKGEPTLARPASWPRRAWREGKKLAPWIIAIAAAILIGSVAASIGPPPAQQIMYALKRGDSVTLIGETGAPRYYRWAVGTGEVSQPRVGEPFLLSCSGSGMVELVPDSQTDRYRFSAEYRVDASTDPDSWGGIYLTHQRNALGTGIMADRAVVLGFSDDLINKAPRFGREFDLITVTDALSVPVSLGGFEFDHALLGSLQVKETKVSIIFDHPWRQIVATVKPDEIEVLWREPDGTYSPVATPPSRTIPNRLMENASEQHREKLRAKRPDIAPERLLPYNPRGGVGLYLRNARVYFRNVVLEPLP